MKIIPEYCKVHNALSIFIGKWKPIIILYLISEETIRYGELKKRLKDITPKMLTNQLRELERDGIVHRKVYPEVPPKVEYSITAYGMTLKPILDSMHEWGLKHEQRRKESVAE